MDDITHIIGNKKICNSSICIGCPSKLYVKDDEVITYGFGNFYSNKIIVLPSYSLHEKGDYISNATILKNILGDKLFEEYYITRDTKCYNVSDYSIKDAALKHCSAILSNELYKFSGKYLFAFGDVDLSYIDYRILNKFKIFRLYNPYVLIVGNDVIKNTFKEQINNMVNL